MRIYFDESSDPMLTGTVLELSSLADQLQQFVNSPEEEFVVVTSTAGNPAPYGAFLSALRLTKRPGPIAITVSPDGELSVTGSTENLGFWVSYFRFSSAARDGDHHHPESVARANYIQAGSLSTIIEIQEVENDAL